MSSDYTPEEEEFIDTYVSAMSGGCTPIEDPERTAEARRGIAKVKADAWGEGYETGCSSPYGTATPSGKPYDPEPNPYRER